MRVHAECKETGLFIPFALFPDTALPQTGHLLVDLEIVRNTESSAATLSEDSSDRSFRELRHDVYEERYARKEQRLQRLVTTTKELDVIDVKFGLEGISNFEDVLERFA